MVDEKFADVLASDLTLPRSISQQVVHGIHSRYSVGGEELPGFFSETVPSLEEYELDITFSMMFTPSRDDRIRYIQFADPDGWTSSRVEGLVEEIVSRKLSVTLELEGGQSVKLALESPYVERYVELLGLELALPDVLKSAIERCVPEDERDGVTAVLRHKAWQSGTRQKLALSYLEKTVEDGSYSLDVMDYLTEFVRGYRIESMEGLSSELNEVISNMEENIETIVSAQHPFFEEQIEAWHGGSHDERDVDERRLEAAQRLYQAALKLRKTLKLTGSEG